MNKKTILGTSQVTWPNDNKAVGNCFHALIAGLRPVGLILARRIAFPLVLLGAGLALIQPCAGQSGTWTITGSLGTARYSHTETLLPNGKVLVAGGFDSSGFSERGTLRSGERDLDGHRQPRHRTLLPHSDVAAQRQGACRRRLRQYAPSRERGTLRSGDRHLDGHRQPRHRTRCRTRRRCCPTARCSSQAVATSPTLASAELYDPASGTWTATGSLALARVVTRRRCCPTARCSSQAVTTARLSRERGTLRSGERDLDAPPAASPPHALITRRRCCPTARCSSQEVMTPTLSRARNSTIRRAGPGRPPAASLPHAVAHGDLAAQRQGARRRRLTSPTALSRARNSTIRPAGPGRPPAASPPHAGTHGDVAAQRQGARRRRFATPSALSRARNSTQATGVANSRWTARPRSSAGSPLTCQSAAPRAWKIAPENRTRSSTSR